MLTLVILMLNKINKMSTWLQALVSDHPCQLTAGQVLDVVMAGVHAPRPLLGSVREVTDQSSDSFHSLESMEKVIPIGQS